MVFFSILGFALVSKEATLDILVCARPIGPAADKQPINGHDGSCISRDFRGVDRDRGVKVMRGEGAVVRTIGEASRINARPIPTAVSVNEMVAKIKWVKWGQKYRIASDTVSHRRRQETDGSRDGQPAPCR